MCLRKELACKEARCTVTLACFYDGDWRKVADSQLSKSKDWSKVTATKSCPSQTEYVYVAVSTNGGSAASMKRF